MRFLIAGLGSIGRRHLRNLVALGERDIVLYRTGQSTLPQDELAGFAVETRLEAALEHKPQAVVVANPTAMHLDVAIPAAKAGCHLLLEKPVSHSLERTEELLAYVRSGGGRVLVGYQYRFHPGLRAARQWLLDGACGRPLAIVARYGDYLPDWHPWEDYRLSYAARPDLGGGVVLTLSHPIDYLRWLLGEADLEWAALAKVAELGIEAESLAVLALRFDTGALGLVHLDFVQRPPTHFFEVVGTEGTVRWDQSDGAARLWRASLRKWEVASPPGGFDRDAMFLGEMAHFRDVVSGVAESACPLEDGLRTLAILHRALSREAAAS
jgi:predicted dehydrogenase